MNMTLSQTAAITKQIIVFSIVLLITAILSFIGYKAWYAYYVSSLPPEEPVADTKFGILPAPEFPAADVSSSNFTYSIDTATGNLPKLGVDEGFDKIIRVYFIPKVYATLLSSEKGQRLAEKFSMNVQPQILSDVNYLFEDGEKVLEVNLDSGNFTYTKQATASSKEAPNANEERLIFSENKLIADFQTLLKSLGIFKEELKNGPNKVVFVKKDGDRFVPAAIPSEAEAVQISLWPQSIDKKPLLTSDYNKALVNAVATTDASDTNNYLSLNFTFWPVDLTTFATYPVKSAEQALQDLKGGRGIIIIAPPKPQASLSSIRLAYFLPQAYSPYLQPIYVFEGAQFVAYVSAISPNFISGQSQDPAK